MFKYLLQHAWMVLKTDGLLTLIQETIKYIGLYHTPDKIIRWWLIKLANVKTAVREVQGSLMMLDLTDKGIHKDLFLNGIREPQATKYLREILEPDWTVVDIGANIGYYALQEANLVEEVIAIEPSPANCEVLETNVDLNGYENIEVHQLAIGDKECDMPFELNRACNWNSIAANGKGDISVKVVRLDRFMNGSKVDFVRMDVEGYEMNVLRGMKQILAESKPRIFIEVHRDKLKDFGSSQTELLEYLDFYGYRIEKAFIMGKESVVGRIADLLSHDRTRKEITERGIASHIFFRYDDTRPQRVYYGVVSRELEKKLGVVVNPPPPYGVMKKKRRSHPPKNISDK
jgi:FkbM family methyltransferase